MKTRFMKGAAIALAAIMLLAGCSSRSGDTATDTEPAKKNTSASTKITVDSSVNDPVVQRAYKDIVAAFEEENPDIEVDLQFPGSEHDNILKVKMAANEMPDIFDTHGWAQVRYGNYLADLRDEPWVPQLTDTIKDVVTDKDGKVYALVLSEAKDGFTYNADLLEQLNIPVPSTFDELMAAADKIVKETNGETVPFHFSGIDDWTIGQYFDLMATPLLISPEQNEKEALLNGTFDWTKWTPLPEKFQEMHKKGYINKDVITAKYSDASRQFAEGKVAFVMVNPSFAEEVRKMNQDMKIGYMPVPALVAGDEPSFSGGERFTMGVWKDTKNMEEAKKLLAFFAKPENMSKIANVTMLPPGLKGVDAKHEFSPYYEQYKDVRVFPYFDRVYLPSGMWDVLCKQGTELLADRITPEQYSEVMKQEVERLRNR
ncbi:extracellular solute-binding protein [Paenibacillus thiaminolyticus]|uniref:Extracellular solute-binding protein n=1 Tax=Paenibacillus thiaminolyticus TaxID=49283 RepID=A0AAP9J243_PANTH|nr:extracellular solute-binding protein [Paenibacillus thiaminolyticus]MCY9538162.1 extracellular solute-binding protein [Paenibacillus thiaminolyticus]MCY9602140.1 extracellular solute-binding protein [Paenibacillus thiaminolyticus]MCY9606000.1 extracellular solute-binding protein [Paenibacillus thiaminolyticus]MCY9612407.1 extracellular solute-binding protein [Paenibacillus thiaminolyticus]MCY9621196.1 extracellular solute-binding protein [Paenibacillus thiaminolyticus]